MGASPASASGAVLPVLSVGMAGENSGLSWWKMTWYRNGAASVATTIFSPMLVVVLRSVLDLGLALYRGEREGGSGCSIGRKGSLLDTFGRSARNLRSRPVFTSWLAGA